MPVNFEDPNIQGALRSKNPIMVGNVPVMHVPFSKITSPEIGFNEYNQMIGLLCISEDQYKDKIENGEIPPPITMLCAFALTDKKTMNLLNRACHLFFGKTPTIDESKIGLVFHSDSLLKCPSCSMVMDKSNKLDECPSCGSHLVASVSFRISNENLADVVSVLRKRNGILTGAEEEWGNPSGAKARQIIARRNELRKKRASAFKQKNGISLWDLIDIYASVSHQSYSVVMDMDIFQLQTQMERYKALDDYAVGVQQLTHGAKSSDVHLKHWIRKLGKDQDSDDDNNDE